MARRALLVGVNRYPDPVNRLRGCLNDVAQVRGLITSRLRVAARDVVTLTDSDATKVSIDQGLHWLVDGAAAGDVLLFHCSGHGSQVEDIDGDEVDDNLDEIICPYDLDWNDPLTDDDLYEIARTLPAGANLTVSLDCCHSGTALRELGAERPAERRGRPRFLAPPRAVPAALQPRVMRRFGGRAARAGAILIAACRSDQAAADASIDGAFHGAFTYYLCRALEESGCSGSYADLIRRVRRLIAEHGFDQVPQLEGPAELLRRPVFAAPTEAAIG